MSQTTPPGPRHARPDEPGPQTTAIPLFVPNEFTDDTTQVFPVIPVQRTAARVERPSGHPPYRPVHGHPAGIPAVAAVPPKPRRRVLPAVLAGVTALLLAAGIVVGVTGATSADLTAQPSSSVAP